jgi:hypothetical protein
MHQCGFGNTLEFITGNVPVVIFPHFGDQSYNAQLILDAQIGVSLFSNWYALKNGTEEHNQYFESPNFTAPTVSHAFT